MAVNDVLKFMSGYSACNVLWNLCDGKWASASALAGIAVITYLISLPKKVGGNG